MDLSAQMAMFSEYEQLRASEEGAGMSADAGARAPARNKTLPRQAKRPLTRLRDGVYGAVKLRFEKHAHGSYYILEELDPRLAILTGYEWVARHLQSLGGVETAAGVWRVRYEDERCSSYRLKRVFMQCSEILDDLHVLPPDRPGRSWAPSQAPGLFERARQMLGMGAEPAVTHA